MKIPLFAALTLAISSANAGVVSVYSDKTDFLSATGSTQLTSSYGSHSLGAYSNVGPSFTSGSLQFTDISSSQSNSSLTVNQTMAITNFSTLIAGDELAFSGEESLNISTASGSLFSIGFDFHEPTATFSSGGNTRIDTTNTSQFHESLFTVSLFDGASLVDSVVYSPLNDQLTFFGLTTNVAFNKLSIIESAGGSFSSNVYDVNIDNEFYGQFYGSATAVPAPSALALMSIGLVGFGYVARKRRAKV